MNLVVYAFQAVPEATDAPAPAAESQPADPGAGPPGGAIGGLLPLLIFIPLIFLLFWQNRSQQKKQEAAIAALKKGDKVVTQSGLIGRLTEIDGRYARLELSPGVKVQVLRSSLMGRDAGDTAPSKGVEGESSGTS